MISLSRTDHLRSSGIEGRMFWPAKKTKTKNKQTNKQNKESATIVRRKKEGGEVKRDVRRTKYRTASSSARGQGKFPLVRTSTQHMANAYTSVACVSSPLPSINSGACHLKVPSTVYCANNISKRPVRGKEGGKEGTGKEKKKREKGTYEAQTTHSTCTPPPSSRSVQNPK